MDFNRIWQEFAPALGRMVASYELNPHRREELLQEVALALWQALPQCRDPGKLKAFVFRIAHNKAADHVSREVREPGLSEDAPFQTPAHPDNVSELRRRALLEAMYQLTVERRQVLALLFEGLSYQEIGDITGHSLSHVGVLINRAKQQLLEYMQHAT